MAGTAGPARYLGLVILSVLASGCATTKREQATIEPMRGPLSEQYGGVMIDVDVQALTAAFTSGTMTFALPNGETCSGTWGQQDGEPASVSPSGGKGLEYYRAWRTYSSGSQMYSMEATCSGGTTMVGEYVAARGGPGLGIAYDSRGNVYRVNF